ncbi:S8 family peptidase [Neolewinella antarctica]|uniref:Thermitase n=1 Tax=Neolewinella antarctica TaxID=442734 RepID=A0ABX0XGN8_9BACT|nr:S8 family serine peptidase [Neolewinella antarctica]NJC28485.1 thermitase [Neolewinella antarctica]
MLVLIITSLLLSLWFFRKNFKDGPLWMLGTYLGIGLLLWTDYQSVFVASEALPRIIRDFLLLGMVGFIQSLAVNKRISVWVAIPLILFIFALAHFLEFEAPGENKTFTDGLQTTMPIDYDEDGEFLVEIKQGQAGEAFRADAVSRGWTPRSAFLPADGQSTSLDDYFVLDVEDVQSAAEILQNLPSVAYFEPNEVIQLSPMELNEVAPKTGTRSSLSINDPFTDQQWAMGVLKMDEYYRLLSTKSPVKIARIAILDTGIDSQHEDLSDNYFSIDTKYDNDPMGHGTHCAGIAAGTTNNGIGIGSLAGSGDQPFVEITGIKVLNAAGMGTQKSIIAGIIEAVDEGVDIISLSLGGPSNGSRQKAYSQAVKYAHDHGAIVIAAAGNSNADAFNYAPANATGMITVSALDQYLLRAPFSNKVDRLQRGIAAPGVGIYSTTPNSTYKVFSGTSMACPFVAGLIGVMKSIDPELNAEEAYDILQQTGLDVADGKVTGRVVQPAAALRAIGN